MSVSVYECDPTSVADLLLQLAVFEQVFASMVVVVPVVLSRSVAVAQSKVTVSVQTTRYQKVSVPPVEGAANVCAIELSPLNADVLPILADQDPVCEVPEMAVALPMLVHRSEEHTSELQSHSDLVCRL